MKLLKGISAGLLCLAVTVMSAPVSAAETRYTPPVPEFLEVSGSVVNVKRTLNFAGKEAFFSDFYTKPYLILLDQQTATSYYPQYQAQAPNIKQENIGNDRKWSISFVKPSSNVTNPNYQFTYYDHLNHPYNEPRPMNVSMNGTKTMEVVTYQYDFKNKRFDSGTSYQTVSQLYFSYVIGSASLSGSSNVYPFASTLGGYAFTVVPRDAGGPNAHYSWWIGRGNITNYEKPIDPVDPDNPDPDSPDYDNMEPDEPMEPFDPEKDGIYTPPSYDDPWTDYDPMDGIEPPDPLPDLPGPPDLDTSGDNPFTPPDLDSSGDNPFTPPELDDSGDNPFTPPELDDSGDNPFTPPELDTSGDNPFTPPELDTSGDNPFMPPELDDTGPNPFQDVPELDDSGFNPFSLEDYMRLFMGMFK